MADLIIPSRFRPLSAPTHSFSRVDATDEAVANLFIAAITGTIDRVAIRPHNVALPGSLFSVGIFSTSSGLPNALINSETVLTLSSQTWQEVTLGGTLPTVTAGTLYAVVCGPASGQTPDGTHYAEFTWQASPGAPSTRSAFPIGCIKAAGTWAIQDTGYTPCICPRYDNSGGNLIMPGFNGGYSSFTTNTFDSADTPDEYGNVFIPEFDCDCVGIQAVIFTSTGSTGNIAQLGFYGSSGGTIDTSAAATASLTGEAFYQTNTASFLSIGIPAQALTAGEPYAVAVKGLHATTTVSTYTATYGHTDYRAAGWNTLQQVTRSDTGAWSAADNTKVMSVQPILTNLSGGGSAGMKRIAGMLGGMRG